MIRQRIPIGILALGLLLTWTAVLSATTTDLGASSSVDDYDDLAIGNPNDQIGSFRPGTVNVLYGSHPGLSSSGNQFWNQSDAGSIGSWDPAEDGDEFGYVLTAGDYNGDGYYDLAIGVPSEDMDNKPDAGGVTVLFAEPPGRLSSVSQFLYQHLTFQADVGDKFGYALATGDFDGDGFDDLAVGVPFEDLGAKVNAGEINVYHGTLSGFAYPTGGKIYHQDVLDIPLESAESGDLFGFALAAGDFNNDGNDDLAVGVPNEDSSTVMDIGVVNILFGSSSFGLLQSGAQEWHQNVPGILDSSEPQDKFGNALATGDFNDDGYIDLAVGVVGEDDAAGAVSVLYGGENGIAYAGNQLLRQKIGNSDLAEAGDLFGFALAAANFDGDRYIDLAIGIPHEHIGTIADAGAVSVVYGSNSGLYSKFGWWFQQDLLDINNPAEADDDFGRSLAAGDFTGDGYTDLAIGVPFEDIGAYDTNAGVVNVVYGASSGLGAGVKADQLWWQNSSNIGGAAYYDDQFGQALVAIPRSKFRLHLPLVVQSNN